MIALAGSAFAWLMGTKAGRVMAAIIAVVLAIAIFGAWERHRGAEAERVRKQEVDRAAITRSNEAEREFRNDGGAAGRLRGNQF